MVPESANCPLGLITIDSSPRLPAAWHSSGIDEDDLTLGQAFVRLASSQGAAYGQQACAMVTNPHADVSGRWLPRGRFKRQLPQHSPQVFANLDLLSVELEIALARTRERLAASSV